MCVLCAERRGLCGVVREWCSAQCGCFVVVVLCAVRIVLGGVRVVVALRCGCCVQSAEGCVASAGVV